MLRVLEIREKEIEQNLLQKAYAFGYLYKENQNEIKETIQKRYEKLELTLNYREKLWNDSLDMVNANLIKMYNAQGEFESSLNSIGLRQNELIRQNTITQEWYFFNKGENSTTAKPQPSIPKLTPSHAGYEYEPVNLKPSKYQRKKK